MEALKIILFCIVAAACYGIAHDQVTARVCVEYFTIGHPPIFRTNSPTLLALGWGIIASFGAGLGVGLSLAVSARSRQHELPPLVWRDMIRPVFTLFLITGVLSLIAGLAGFFTARAGGVYLLPPLSERVPREKHVYFLADYWAHIAAYGMAMLGMIVIFFLNLRRRRKMRAQSTS